MREPAAKLFHCVVVMGAAMGSGCGSGHLVDADAGADGAGASGGGGGGSSSGGAGGSSSGFGVAVCDAGFPHTAADCPDPAQFICDDYTMPCGCQCFANAPTGPEQCCPALDASADAADAGDSGDGPVADAAFVPAPYCQTPFTCDSYDPPTGCACRMIPPPIL